MKKTAVDAGKVFVYNPKFDYKPLSRVSEDGKRLYATPDGKRLPSVTTVLDKTKPEEKKAALNEWRRRVGVENAQKITTEAANRGTRMHTYLEDYIKQGQLKERGSNPFGWASHAMARLADKQPLLQRPPGPRLPPLADLSKAATLLS